MADLIFDESLMEGIVKMVDRSYVEQARQVAVGRSSRVKQLVRSRKLPDEGWCEDEIVSFLGVLSAMDSNNFEANVGVGEREARVASPLVRRLHLGMAHGVGRSGDVAAVQPKAAGSSLLSKLANALALDALREAGLVEMKSAIIVPCATGLSLALCLLALRGREGHIEAGMKRTVIWMRIDQKSCLKGIALAGMKIVVVEPTRSRSRGSAPRDRKTATQNGPPALLERDDAGDELLTDLSQLRAAMSKVGPEELLCVVSTTSCFAPRSPDDVEAIARLCAAMGVCHVVNNAYGVQCSRTCANISRAQRVGRVDLVVQSTDKNFLVPVGGAVVASANAELVDVVVAKSYPGRASATPARDLFITLLGLGKVGWKRLLREREELLPTFQAALAAVAAKHGERLLDCPHNHISFALSLDTLQTDSATKFGSMLFTRCCSGTRVVAPVDTSKTIAGISFARFGANSSSYPVAYLTAACALGLAREELEQFVLRLDRTFTQIKRRNRGSSIINIHGTPRSTSTPAKNVSPTPP